MTAKQCDYDRAMRSAKRCCRNIDCYIIPRKKLFMLARHGVEIP